MIQPGGTPLRPSPVGSNRDGDAVNLYECIGVTLVNGIPHQPVAILHPLLDDGYCIASAINLGRVTHIDTVIAQVMKVDGVSMDGTTVLIY